VRIWKISLIFVWTPVIFIFILDVTHWFFFTNPITANVWVSRNTGWYSVITKNLAQCAHIERLFLLPIPHFGFSNYPILRDTIPKIRNGGVGDGSIRLCCPHRLIWRTNSTCRKWCANFRSYVRLYTKIIENRRSRRREEEPKPNHKSEERMLTTLAAWQLPPAELKGNPINDKINKFIFPSQADGTKKTYTNRRVIHKSERIGQTECR